MEWLEYLPVIVFFAVVAGAIALLFWKRARPWSMIVGVAVLAIVGLVVVASTLFIGLGARSDRMDPPATVRNDDGERPHPVWRTSLRNPDTGAPLGTPQKNKPFHLRLRFANRPSKCKDGVEREVSWTVADLAGREVTLDVMLVADPKYFEVTDGSSPKPILISSRIPEEPCGKASVRDNEPMNQAATATFALTAKDVSGFGNAALVFYRDGRPIDELPLRICVGSCLGEAPLGVDMGFSDTVHGLLNAAERAPPTDASIYLYDFAAGVSAGTLALRATDGTFKYIVWTNADRSVRAIRDSLETTYAPLLSTLTNASDINRQARNLAQLLFPRGRGDEARRELEAYLVAARKESRPPPSLLVRVSGKEGPASIVFPIGLVAMRSVTDGSGYLGRYARVIMPLNEQNYSDYDECPEQIITVLPTKDDANPPLQSARRAMGDAGTKWWAAAGDGYRWSSTREFSDWLAPPDVPGVDTVTAREIRKPAAMFLLTHHYNDTIWINANDKTPSDVVSNLEFKKPSWVVMNGCETANPEMTAAGFVRYFNKQGAQAVIATHAEVPAALAGAYYKCMDQQFEKIGDGDTVRLGSAHFDAIACLWNEVRLPAMGSSPAVRWGPNALKYTLLGNPNLRVCRIK